MPGGSNDDCGAAVAHRHPVQLTGIALGDEQLLPGGHAVLFALQNGVAQTVAAAVTVQRGLGGLPARVPYGVTVLDVDSVAVHVQRGVVEAIHAKPKLVILEKPVALNLSEAEKIRQEAEKFQVPVLVNHERRFAEDFKLAKISIIVMARKLEL